MACIALPIGAEEIASTVAAADTTLFGRLYEFFADYRNDIITIALGGAVILLDLIFNKRNTARHSLISKGIEVLKSGSATTLDSQADVIRVSNELIDVINRLDESYKEFMTSYAEITAAEVEREKAMSYVVELEKIIVEILALVYPNSAHLPQGVKDIISLKYAKFLKLVEGASDDAG